MLHMSTGDVFREAVARGTELGNQVRDYIARGDYVPDEIALPLVTSFLESPEACEKGVLLDGFPRTPAQAEALTKRVDVNSFILIQAPDGVCVERVLERRVDPETNDSYHLKFVPPPPDVMQRLVRREHDVNDKVIKRRIRTFHCGLGSVLTHFMGKIQIVDGSKKPDEVFASISRCATTPISPDDVASAHAVDQLMLTLQSYAAGEEMNEEANALNADDDDWGEDETDTGAGGSGITIEAAPSTFLANLFPTGTSNGTHVSVTIKIPDTPQRQPIDVCCAVDISGSMGQIAKYEEEDGTIKDDGLTLLDIVKHAVKTVMHMLTGQDRLALCAFDHQAEMVFQLGEMTDAGRAQALVALEGLMPRGRTNIWQAIRTSMDALKVPPRSGEVPRKKCLLLLTDGVPNEIPPRGHITELKDYKEVNPSFSFTLNTFGFGNQLDSSLLFELATEAGGTFSFIPDAKIVGTCFVNYIANAVSTLTQTSTLHLMPRNGAEFRGPVMGDFVVADASWGRVVSLGPLQFGQSRIVVLPMSCPAGESKPCLEVVVVHPDQDGNDVRVAATAAPACRTPADAALAFARADTVSTTYQAIKDFSQGSTEPATEAMAALRGRMSMIATALSTIERCERLEEIQKDVEGRMTKAMSTQERFNRWGRHYLPALARAHQLQLCTNFMDPGLQQYGGSVFQEVKEEGGKIFLSLPLPTPARPAARPSVTRTSTSSVAAAAPAAATYYAGSGGG
jgi:adenylate kinase family enzyme/Mg-chelatase subunit ChlD